MITSYNYLLLKPETNEISIVIYRNTNAEYVVEYRNIIDHNL